MMLLRWVFQEKQQQKINGIIESQSELRNKLLCGLRIRHKFNSCAAKELGNTSVLLSHRMSIILTSKLENA